MESKRPCQGWFLACLLYWLLMGISISRAISSKPRCHILLKIYPDLRVRSRSEYNLRENESRFSAMTSMVHTQLESRSGSRIGFTASIRAGERVFFVWEFNLTSRTGQIEEYPLPDGLHRKSHGYLGRHFQNNIWRYIYISGKYPASHQEA